MDFVAFLSLYMVGALFFVLADLIWIGVLMRSFYQRRLGHLLGMPGWMAAGCFYLIFIFGLTYFVTYPAALHGTHILTVLGIGALFGLVTYGTYDLTNHATLKNWPGAVTVVDMVWGSVLCAAVAGLTLFTYQSFISI